MSNFVNLAQNLKKFPVSPFKHAYGVGRTSNSGKTIAVFGAYGFVGKYLLQELGSTGSRVYAPFRGDPDEVRVLKPMFDLGNLALIPFHPYDKQSIADSIRDADVVVNLIGKHFETKHIVPTRKENGKISRVNYTYEDVHVKVARNVAEVAKDLGVKHFVHISSLSADHHSPSEWSRSKAKGEDAVREVLPDATIVRLATVFGSDDRFLNTIAESNSRLPFFPLVENGQALTQPIYAADVGKALFQVVENIHYLGGADVHLAGPDVYTFKEVVEYVQDVTRINKKLVDVPLPVASLTGKICEQMIDPFFTEDMTWRGVEDSHLRNADEEDKEFLTAEDLGVELNSLERVGFDFLYRFRKGGHFVNVEGYH